MIHGAGIQRTWIASMSMMLTESRPVMRRWRIRMADSASPTIVTARMPAVMRTPITTAPRNS